MPRESICVPISKDPLYEASMAFLAAIAHPTSEANRKSFHLALCRHTIKSMAAEDAEFAWKPQVLKPGYFLMGDDAASKALRDGWNKIAVRKAAVVSTFPLFDEALRGKPIPKLTAFGTSLENTPGNRHLMTNTWLKKKSGASVKNVTSQIEAPTRPVIHAAQALWRSVIALRNQGVENDDVALGLILHRRKMLALVLESAEICGRMAVTIPALKVKEADLVQFVAT
jgi:hypothetical protein